MFDPLPGWPHPTALSPLGDTARINRPGTLPAVALLATTPPFPTRPKNQHL